MSNKLTSEKSTVRPTATIPVSPEQINALKDGFSESEFAPIAEALTIPVPQAPPGPKRPRGIDVALILKHLGVDPVTLVAAILSDPLLQGSLELPAIQLKFGPLIATLVRNVRWLNTFNVYSPAVISNPDQAEILRRMLLAMVDDIRALLIKLAFRVQRLRNLSDEDYEVRKFISRETLDIYARLANRLGIGHFKWELEDLAFRYLYPQIYKKIANSLAESRSQREAYLQRIVHVLEHSLSEEGIVPTIIARPKHIYSIWKKMQRKKVDFANVFDLRAVRIFVDDVSTCYKALGVIHSLFQYVPQEFDDYIANPKTNGYQSLHTVVIGPENAPVEIQIRTFEMDQFAELGVAAHWRYKEGGKLDHAATKSIESIRKLLDHQNDDHKLLDYFRTDLYTNRIFVLTPNRELKELPRGSTPLDFAYTIHTEVGHRCRGAKVNQRIVPLTYSLQSGEQVEILTRRDSMPRRSWLDPNLGYLKTPGARAKVRQWFRKQAREHNLREGKSIFDKIRQNYRIGEIDRAGLLRQFRLASFDDFLIAIGRADISSNQLRDALRPQRKPQGDYRLLAQTKILPTRKNDHIQVHGVTNLLTAFAKCCNPVHGDPVIGYLSGSKGVVIHRVSCQNLQRMSSSNPDRILDIDWSEPAAPQRARILVIAIDRNDIQKQIAEVCSNEKAQILQATTQSALQNPSFTIDLTIAVLDLDQLNRIIEKLTRLPDVISASRIH
ncbi:MAG: RelA/SpoT family protein [Gammaproteobacteria bacterium]